MFEKCLWIKAPCETEEEEVSPVFIKRLDLRSNIKKVVLFATAMGMYQVYVNEKTVDSRLMAPGFTSYSKRIQYQTYDLTEHFTYNKAEKEKEEIGITLKFLCGKGWAIGKFGFYNQGNNFADHISLIFDLRIEYEDGSMEQVVSDEQVEVCTSQILSSEIYHGEIIDHTAAVRFLGYAAADKINSRLVPQQGENIVENERLKPLKILTTLKGEKVVDFGQNLTGYVEVRASAPQGSRIVMRHAEVLDQEGNFYTENLRAAKQMNVYVFNGESEECFKPSFSFQGFRYICLDECPKEINPKETFTAVAIHSNMKRTCHFVTGNSKINQLYHNIVWGQKSNFLDIPTDCPQRDERLGWTGDAQVFCRTAAINFDVEKFFLKWLEDMVLEQSEEGGVGGFVPDFNISNPKKYSAAWGDAMVICPWEIYLAYGNQEFLRRFFPYMKKWVDYIHQAGKEEYLWLGGDHFGDWLAMDAGDGVYEGATHMDFIASAFFAHSTNIMVKAGKILGEYVTEYESLLGNIKESFQKKFLKEDLPVYNTQTACTLVLHFGLSNRPDKTAKRLYELVESNDMRLNTGFIGTPYLLHALSENGYERAAYDLLLQERFPSWLYSVNHEATTIWEHWDGIKEDGSFWSKDMNSFNHYAYGAVFDWIFRNTGGIRVCEDGAGYRKVKLQPVVEQRLGFAECLINTRQGPLSSNWYIQKNQVRFEYYIPAGIKATVILPDGKNYILDEGEYIFYNNLSK